MTAGVFAWQLGNEAFLSGFKAQRYQLDTAAGFEEAKGIMGDAILADVRRDIGRLLNSYQEKVRNIDEYIIHPGLKDLHLVRRCILWMPAGTA